MHIPITTPDDRPFSSSPRVVDNVTESDDDDGLVVDVLKIGDLVDTDGALNDVLMVAGVE
jgi:hypothetical protein